MNILINGHAVNMNLLNNSFQPIPLTKLCTTGLNCSFDGSLHMLLNKQSSFRLFETPYDVTVIDFLDVSVCVLKSNSGMKLGLYISRL